MKSTAPASGGGSVPFTTTHTPPPNGCYAASSAGRAGRTADVRLPMVSHAMTAPISIAAALAQSAAEKPLT
jgi:hypothetical protein